MAGDTVKSVTSVKVPTELYNPFNTNTSSSGTTAQMDSIWNSPLGYMGGGYAGIPFTGGFSEYDLMNTFDTFSYMGSMPGMFGGFPMFTGGNYQQYFDMMDQYNQAMTDNQVRQQERVRNSELRYNAPLENINITVGHLNEKIVTDNQDQILDAYADFKEAVRAMYGGTEEQVNARAQAIYKEKYQTSITEDIRKHGKSAFSQAFSQTMQAGVMIDHTSAEYNVSQITGQPIGRSERDSKTVGHFTGGMTFGAVAGAIVGGILCLFTKNPKTAFAISTALGALGGGAIGESSGEKNYK